VADYKLYCLDRGGRITRRHEFEALDDTGAIEFAREHYPETDCELWSGTRKVGLVPAHGGAPVLSRSTT